LILLAMVVLCVATLAPSISSSDNFPKFWPLNHLFGNQINLGLDLQGGKHIVYGIDLDKAVDDKASEIKRDIDARLQDDKIKGSAKTPASPLGAVSVTITDEAKKPDEIKAKLADLKVKLEKDYNDREKVVEWRECQAPDALKPLPNDRD